MLPITKNQAKRVATVRGNLARATASGTSASHKAAGALLEELVEAWFAEHASNSSDYPSELDALNKHFGWTGAHSQLASWTDRRTHWTHVLCPKFFGGDIANVDPDYVLAISLNHAVLDSPAFAAETVHQQTLRGALDSFTKYFKQPYAYPRFFRARAKVLRAYAAALGKACSASATWQDVNSRWAVYIERLPTRSKKCALIPTRLPSSFLIELNDLAHEIIFTLAPPRAILLAGRSTWSLISVPDWTAHHVRAKPSPACPVGAGHHTGVRNSRVVRCNFLRTINGPNSDAELDKLGALLAT